MNYNHVTDETYKKMDISIYFHDWERLTVRVKYPCGEIEHEWPCVYDSLLAIQLAKNYINRMELDDKLENPHCEDEECQEHFAISRNNSADLTIELQPAELGLYQIYVGSESQQVTLYNWFSMTKQDLSHFANRLVKLLAEISVILEPETIEA